MTDRQRSRLTISICAILVLAVLLACKKDAKKEETTAEVQPSAAPAATPKAPDVTEKVFKVGETAVADDYTQKGNIYLGVEVLVESKADRQMFVSPVQAKLVDAEGITTNHKFIYKSSCDPKLAPSTRLAKGEKAKGWVTFEVAKEAKGLKLSYTPGIYQAQTVKFDLGR